MPTIRSGMDLMLLGIRSFPLPIVVGIRSLPPPDICLFKLRHGSPCALLWVWPTGWGVVPKIRGQTWPCARPLILRIPPPIGERRTTFAETYGIKKRCYWECVGEHKQKHEEQIGNVMRTHCELDENPTLELYLTLNLLGSKWKKRVNLLFRSSFSMRYHPSSSQSSNLVL